MMLLLYFVSEAWAKLHCLTMSIALSSFKLLCKRALFVLFVDETRQTYGCQQRLGY